ncbi:MAG: Rho-binding antiterminator [Woeseia sp.]
MSDDNYTPIDCGIHDQLELACMRGQTVRLTTTEETLTGVPLTTRTSPERAEWLVFEVAAGRREIRLDRLRKLEPLDGPNSGEAIVFSPQR